MFVKLSYPICEEATIYPGNSPTKFTPTFRIANGDLFNCTDLHLFTHNGTHMDAPWHINPEGKHVDELDVEDWIFNKPKIIDVSNRPNRDIDRSDIEPFFSKNDDSDLLLVFSGMSLMRDSDPRKYTSDFPAFTTSAAKFIIEETKLRGIALDFISVDSVDNMNAGNFPAHHIIFGRGEVGKRTVIIIEDVNIASILSKKVKRVFAVPLPLKGMDGSPVNMFAEVD